MLRAAEQNIEGLELSTDFHPFNFMRMLPEELDAGQRALLHRACEKRNVRLDIHSPIIGPYVPSPNPAEGKQRFFDPATCLALQHECVQFAIDVGAEAVVVHVIDADHIVKGDGVRWFRKFLGQYEAASIRHPAVISGFGTRIMGVSPTEKPGDTSAMLIPSVGCPVGCAFCATGQDGFVRDLTAGEIVVQALRFARKLADAGARLSNVVYMGMGEPLLNYDATLRSVRILNDPRALGLGMRSFTISTAGVVPGIDRLACEGLEVNLAVSLHTVDDALRRKLIPLARAHPVDDLLAACRRYFRTTHRRVTFEIALLREVNDTEAHARAVAERLHGMACHVNLIPGNACPDEPFRPSERDRVDGYAQVLTGSGIATTVRVARGLSIDAGCGQLRRRRATR